jgi:hypothetical protein
MQHMAKEAPLTINHVFAGIAVADYGSASRGTSASLDGPQMSP